MGKERVLDEMARQEVDVLLLGREGNARYVSGANRLFLAGERAFAPGCVVVAETSAVHVLSVTDFGIPPAIAHADLYPPSWNPATTVGRIAALPGVDAARRIGVDGLTPLFEALVTTSRPGTELVDGEAVMRAARRIKSAEEVTHIRAAANVAGTMMAAALDAVASGARDATVKAIAMETMSRAGASTFAFEPRIEHVGYRTTVAVGTLVDGWEADLTRTVPGPERPDALTAALGRCRTGRIAGDIGADVHGVGLGYEVLSRADRLEPGMVLSVGVDGARDTVLVTDGAPELLTG